MFRTINKREAAANRIISAARRKEYRENKAHRYPHPATFVTAEPAAPHRLDFHNDANVDWSLLDSDDRFGGGY